jgi:uncharacterized membrane protein YfcA
MAAAARRAPGVRSTTPRWCAAQRRAILGFVYLPALLWVALASLLTAPLGAKAAHRMNVGLLRKLFAVLLIVLATRLLLKVL